MVRRYNTTKMLNPLYQISLYMSFIAIACFTIVPYTLMHYYMYKDISWDELENYHTLSFLIGIICAVLSCYIPFKYGVF